MSQSAKLELNWIWANELRASSPFPGEGVGSFPTGVSVGRLGTHLSHLHYGTPVPLPCGGCALSYLGKKDTKESAELFSFCKPQASALPRYSPRLRRCTAAADTGSIPVARRAQHAREERLQWLYITISRFHSRRNDELTVMDST